ncbi:MAG: cytochrome c oxidase subunit II transmembrane domain-containing protein, partial [Dehalococcoidia bacterium]
MRKAARRWPVRTTGILLSVALLSLLSVNAALALDPTGQPPGVTDEANTMHNLYIFVSILALAVLVAVEAALVFMIFRFRKKSDELPPQVHGNNVLEIIWTAIPMIIVLVLFVASFVVLIDVEQDADDEDLTVQVEGFQFSWIFTYSFNDLGTNGSEEGSEETFSIEGRAG